VHKQATNPFSNKPRRFYEARKAHLNAYPQYVHRRDRLVSGSHLSSAADCLLLQIICAMVKPYRVKPEYKTTPYSFNNKIGFFDKIEYVNYFRGSQAKRSKNCINKKQYIQNVVPSI
jgi:hypothetical protein